MFELDKNDHHRKKLGYYQVGNQRFTNKYMALNHSSQSDNFHYDFNNDVFSNCDWSQEPTDDLYEIYRKRAQQLRDRYDNLVLYFSGGVDSTVILMTFLENQIPLDGVVMYGTWALEQQYQDQHLDTVEQNIVGRNLIRELEKKYNTKINLYLLDTTKYYQKFEDENFVYAGTNYVGPRMFCHNFYWQDPWMQSWQEKGTTAFIRGIDKPRVFIEDGYWTFGFLDVQMIDSAPSGIWKSTQDHAITEYFYWTPDLPELVIKQAHIVADYFEKHLPMTLYSTLATKTHGFDATTYNKYIDPLVYGKYITQKPGQDRTYFSIPKSIAPGLVQKDFWFYQAGKDQMSREFKIWKAGIRHLQQTIPMEMINVTTDRSQDKNFDQWIHNLFGKFNILDLGLPKIGEPHIIWGPKGSWSTLYKIRPVKFSTGAVDEKMV